MQQRIIFFISGLFAVVIIAVALMLQQRPETLSKAEIEQLIEQKVAQKFTDIGAQAASVDEEPTPIDSAQLGPLIDDYLMQNPSLLQRMSVALQQQAEQEQNEKARLALTAMKAPIYDDPDHVVLGNPEGDVTLVEFFDYNCGFCRQALADILQLLDEDKNVRLILKEFPILSQGSADAARVALLVGRNKDVNYLDFHTQLFASRGQIDKQKALDAAASLGMNPIELELQMGDQSVSDAIGRTYQIADALGISSTPNFIIGNEILRGAVGIEEMREKVKNMRTCGKPTCN